MRRRRRKKVAIFPLTPSEAIPPEENEERAKQGNLFCFFSFPSYWSAYTTLVCQCYQVKGCVKKIPILQLLTNWPFVFGSTAGRQLNYTIDPRLLFCTLMYVQTMMEHSLSRAFSLHICASCSLLFLFDRQALFAPADWSQLKGYPHCD